MRPPGIIVAIGLMRRRITPKSTPWRLIARSKSRKNYFCGVSEDPVSPKLDANGCWVLDRLRSWLRLWHKAPFAHHVPIETGQTFPAKTGHRSHDSGTPSTVECLRMLNEGRKPKVESSERTRWVGPAPAWAAAFIVCVAADALLGRWVLLPVFVVGFYGGG